MASTALATPLQPRANLHRKQVNHGKFQKMAAATRLVFLSWCVFRTFWSSQTIIYLQKRNKFFILHFYFMILRTSDLYFSSILSIFSRHPLSLTSTCLLLVDKALLSVLATSFHSWGYSGKYFANSFARASSCFISGHRNGAMIPWNYKLLSFLRYHQLLLE